MQRMCMYMYNKCLKITKEIIVPPANIAIKHT